MKKIKVFFVAVALLLTSVALAQRSTVSGVISDSANGEPVPFASVMVKGTMNGVSSDADGKYSISAPAGATLVFSSVGYTTQEVVVGAQAVINIALSADSKFLEDALVIGYGTSTKSAFTGSASIVKADKIKERVTTNVTQALAGTTAGVQVFNSSGDPTSNSPAIRIRGIGSMYASNAPLYVVDGMPYDGGISNINPNDVESMTVLKDAAANAIYGARGANGVVIITTKKAQDKDGRIQFEARFGSNSRLIPQYDVVTDPAQYYELHYRYMFGSQYYNGASIEAAYAYADANLFDADNGGLGHQVFTVPAGELFIGRNFKLNPKATLGYDKGGYWLTPDSWYDETFHNSFRKEYTASFSGSTPRLNYYASVGYLDDGGIVENSAFERYTARINASYQVKKWAKVTSAMNYVHGFGQRAATSSTWGSSGNVFYISNMIAPIYPLYVRKTVYDPVSGDPTGGEIQYENGYPVFDSNQLPGIKRAGVVGNAVRDNLINKREQINDNLTNQWGLVLTPLKGLSLTANVGTYFSTTRSSTLSSIFASGSAVGGAVSVSQSHFLSVDQQYLAEYKTSFGGAHNIDVLIGTDRYSFDTRSVGGYNDHLYNPGIPELDNSFGEAQKVVSSGTDKYMHIGYLSRAQYDYLEKIFVSASFRRDASSRLAPDHRWGNFWSVGAAWLISKEDFFAIDWVDMLKLKASFGQQGNDDLGTTAGYYPYADQYTPTYNPDTDEYGLNLTWKGNRELKWEKHNTFNIGADFELFGGKLNGSLEYFNRQTHDMLYYKNTPLSAGNPTGMYPVNVGSVRNSGVELTLGGNIINNSKIAWDWNANISHYKNKILALDPTVAKDGIKRSYYIYEVGGSLEQAYMYKYAGVDKATGKALYYKENEDKSVTLTDVLDDATKFDCGDILPKLYGGFGTSVKAFGFDFSCQFSFQLGGRYYDGSYQNLMHTQNSAGSAWHKDALKAWTPENTDTDVPRLDGDTTIGQTAIDRFFVSSNYLSVNNVTLGYTLPKNLVSKVGVEAVRVYVTGDNLAVLTARKGIDPRFTYGLGSYTAGSGLNTNSYSSVRTITGGISLTF